ncbi:uncharacterized protein F4807DRAFT_445236 [Annulohypoxylon truncatum]|uniref:uncharacterized protein n=1 Tax=Annulohypoxylon truncatum TaxID=327061 RepID=UPI0020072CC7|nr:uncharacterized protein F4807DRAFT_445236 [Annulohypoxylon truncatum]KAI1204836.1 hypothetical protein F4807DRAFT_445236 [Annulohypoxylon truncatum]
MHNQIHHQILVAVASLADSCLKRMSSVLSITLLQASNDSTNLIHESQHHAVNSKYTETQEKYDQISERNAAFDESCSVTKVTKSLERPNNTEELNIDVASNSTASNNVDAGNTRGTYGNSDDPFRDPLSVPNVSPPIMVYPHSTSRIPRDYNDRFGEIVTLFRQNTRDDPRLRRHVRDIDYSLRFCGPSERQACPSILVFCRPDAYQPLQHLLSRKFLKVQYCVSKSTREHFWQSQTSYESRQDTYRPYFKLYFWRALIPRVLLGVEEADIHFGRGNPINWPRNPTDDSWLTMSGFPIYQSPGESQTSTMGCVIQVGLRYYGLTACHSIRDRHKSFIRIAGAGKSGLERIPNQPDTEKPISLPYSAEKLYTLEIGTNPLGADELEEDDLLEFDDDVVYEELTNNQGDEYWYQDSDSIFTQDPRVEPQETKTEDEGEHSIKKIALCPSSEQSDTLHEELDLDWALIPLDRPIHRRPNAFLNPSNMGKPTFMSPEAARFPDHETEVLLISSPRTIHSGVLQPSWSVLGGINDDRPSRLGSLILENSKGLVRGNSGSLVVDAHTYAIYGHVIGSNPLGEIYVSPLSLTLKQIENFFPELEVSLPEPMPLLAKSADHYMQTLRAIETKTFPDDPKDQSQSRIGHNYFPTSWLASNEFMRFLAASREFFQEMEPISQEVDPDTLKRIGYLWEALSTSTSLPISRYPHVSDPSQAEHAISEFNSIKSTSKSVRATQAFDIRLALSILQALGMQQTATTLRSIPSISAWIRPRFALRVRHATSAATTFFKPIRLGRHNNHQLVDRCVKGIVTSHESQSEVPSGSIEGYHIRACFHVPFPKNERFTGRSSKLDEIKQKLFKEQCSKVALVGLSGIGQTQFALQFAYWVKEKKPEYSVLWVPAVSDASFEQAYGEIAKKLGIQKTSDNEDIRDAVRDHLSSDQSSKWLLIIDNADDTGLLFGSPGKSAGINQYLPRSDNVVTLFTTRFRKVAQSCAEKNIIEITEMDQQEAVRFFDKLFDHKSSRYDESEANELVNEFWYLPLAIKQAVAYLLLLLLLLLLYCLTFERTGVGFFCPEFTKGYCGVDFFLSFGKWFEKLLK